MTEKEIEKEAELEWEVQKKLNVWDLKRRANATLEELMEGKVRYLKFIKIKIGPKAVEDVLGIFVQDNFNKNMSGLTKLGAGVLKKVSKKILLKKIVTSFFINLQHLVNIDRIAKMEFYPDLTEVVIQKCTAKRAWKLGLRNNDAEKLFTNLEFCEKFCHPMFNRFLGVADAHSTVKFQKRGCEHFIKFLNK